MLALRGRASGLGCQQGGRVSAAEDTDGRHRLEARGVTKYFPVKKGFLKRTVGQLKAVDGVDLDVYRGETVGLVGESGCGKSTLGRTLLRLLEPTSGTIRFDGDDVTTLGRSDLKAARRHMQIVFQDSVGSLDQDDGEAARRRGAAGSTTASSRSGREAAVLDMLERVGLPREAADRYPHQFSGGQRQRTGLARSLVLQPKFIVGDQPVPRSTCRSSRRCSTSSST